MTKVLYIAGWGRSGSTILDTVLGQLDGFASTGEVRHLWERGLVDGKPCGCGEPVSDCPLWSRVLRRAFGAEGVDAAALAEHERRGPRTRHLPLLVAGRGRWAPELRDALARLYPAIAAETGARVVVDSSKSPVYARLLDTLPGIDLYVVHLVRDPRGVAYSWRRPKAHVGERVPRLMTRHGSFHSSLMWVLLNAATWALLRRPRSRYLVVRYEDFVAAPRATVERIAALVGERPETLPFEDERTVRLEPTHTASGNPGRFRTGLVELRPDVEWTQRLSLRDRVVSTVTASPLLRAYRYPFVPAERAR